MALFPPLSQIGVPPLLNPIANWFNVGALLKADATLFLRQFGLAQDPPWGLYFGTEKVLTPDSVLAIEFKKDWSHPKYPMELGAFQTYNKVTQPYDVRVTMVFGGSDSKRSAALLAVEKVASSLELYALVMPDAEYQNLNVAHYDFKRSADNGIGLLTVNLWLTEIRNTIRPAFANVASPSSANPSATSSRPGASQPAPTGQQ